MRIDEKTMSCDELQEHANNERLETPMPIVDSHEDQDPASLASPDVRAQQIRVRNRRRMYLLQHPEYLDQSDLELVDPLLYDRTIRRFQTAAERQAQGASRGYGGVLEADLSRSEARLAALSAKPKGKTLSARVNHVKDRNANGTAESSILNPYPKACGIPNREVRVEQPLDQDESDSPTSKAQGLEIWRAHMTQRFLDGQDTDFTYESVDEDESLDVVERREREEAWFESEAPTFCVAGAGGETGVQDF